MSDKLPFPVGFVPPPSPDAAPVARGASPGVAGVPIQHEAWAETIPWPITGEVSLWKSKRRWRACDVYVSLPVASAAGVLFSFFVYAILPSGVRTLVSSGRYPRQSLSSFTPNPVWVVAARSQAVGWELTCLVTGSATADKVSISAVVSDEANDPPAWVGVVPMGSAAGLPLSSTAVRTHARRPELVMVQGVVGPLVATPRYLHVHDAGAGSMAGNTPLFSFPLGSGIGAGGGFGGMWSLDYRSPGYAAGVDTLQVVASSTADISTLAVDCTLQGLWR